MREVVIDIEASGLDPDEGHRIISIGVIERVDGKATGRTFGTLLNPSRPIAPESLSSFGYTDEMLSGAPTFSQIAQDLVDFLGNDTLLVSARPWALSYLNKELALVGIRTFDLDRAVDLLDLLRAAYPGERADSKITHRRLGLPAPPESVPACLRGAWIKNMLLDRLASNEAAELKPRLGIFWGCRLGNGKPLVLPVSIAEMEVPLIAGFRTLEMGHVDAWPTVRRTIPLLKGKEYDEVPRGRVNWRESDGRYLLLADRKLLSGDFLKQIMALFELPVTKTLVMSDPHYRTSNDAP